MKSVKDIGDLSGKRVLALVDLNVPMKDGIVLDDFRIRKAIPTIKLLSEGGAKVILISHLGDDGSATLAPVAQAMGKYLPNIKFIGTPIISDETRVSLESLNPGSIVLLENTRSNPGEVENLASFGKELSAYGDLYVNEAFSVSHRKYTSVVGLPKHLPGYVGLQFMNEVEHLSRAFTPEHPFLFILGGAKFSTKIPLIKKFLQNADTLFITGALATDFFRAQGHEVGLSLVDDGDFDLKSLMEHQNLVLPIDVEVAKKDQNIKSRFVLQTEVMTDDIIVDIGPMTVYMVKRLVDRSHIIIWNGPIVKS
ncbi:MAG: phosphoglycerate kinase [bacterium]